jgi:hypothetical protein
MALLCFFSLYRYPIQLATFSTYPASVEARMNSLAENKFEICTKVSEVTGTLLTPLRALLTPLCTILPRFARYYPAALLPHCDTTPLLYYPAVLLPRCATTDPELRYHPAALPPCYRAIPDTTRYFHGLFIKSAKMCLHGKTPLRLGHLAPVSEVTGSEDCLTILESADNSLLKMVRYVLLRPLRPELDGQEVEASSREDTPSSSRLTAICT